MHVGVIATMKKGLEQFTYREVRELARQGATISLFPTKHRPGLYNPPPEWNTHRWRAWAVVLSQPLRLLRMPVRYLAVLMTAIRYGAIVDFLMAAYFAPWLRQVDVIYATFGDHKFFVGYFGKLLLDKPLAVEIHAHELYVNPNPKLFEAALASCDQIIAATEYNRNVLRDRYGIPPEQVEVVRYAIDLAEYRPEKKFVILIVAFFVERKGHEVLFRAVKQLGYDDVELWVVGGEGAEQAGVDVRALAKQLKLESQVAFFGKLSGTALRAVYHSCDVFCLPCRHEADGNAEGFPVVLIEAMACGKPVITTRHVEIPRIVEQILVDENDVDGLTEAIRQVYASTALREQLGGRSRELAETHFSTDNTRQTSRLLSRIAAGATPPSPAPAPTDRGGKIGAGRVVIWLQNDGYPDDTRVRLEAQTLREVGYDVSVICRTGASRQFHEDVDGVHVYRFPMPWEAGGLLGYVWEYAYSLSVTFFISLWVALRHGFDVIHARTPPDMYVLVAAFYKLLGKRYVVDMNDLPLELYQAQHDGRGNRLICRLLRWFERLNCRLADRCLATSATQRRVLIERGGVPADRCHLVRNVPSEEFLEPVEPLASLRERGRTVIGYMGITGFQDRVDVMLRALSTIKHELGRTDFLAVIVGSGAALEELKRLADELKLADDVHFTGYRVGDDLLRHVASFDICVVPDPSNPYNDSCAMLKLMEYMAMAKPVVAFDLPENRLTAGDAAIYVKDNDEREFARQIARLMDDADLRRRLGRLGRQRVLEHLAWDYQKRHLIEAYDRLLDGEPTRNADSVTNNRTVVAPTTVDDEQGVLV